MGKEVEHMHMNIFWFTPVIDIVMIITSVYCYWHSTKCNIKYTTNNKVIFLCVLHLHDSFVQFSSIKVLRISIYGTHT